MPEAQTPELRLSARGRAVRMVAAALGIGVLAYGSVAGSEELFPAGPMTQYAFYVDPDGEVASTIVEADTTAGSRVRVDLSPGGVGIRRAAVEGRLPAIVADPSRLRALAVGQRRLHPDEPQFTHLYVVQEVTPLHDGAVGEPFRRVIADWAVT